MADAMDQRKLLMQNLEDAGCGAADIARFFQLERGAGAWNSCGCCGCTAPCCWTGSTPVSGRSTALTI